MFCHIATSAGHLFWARAAIAMPATMARATRRAMTRQRALWFIDAPSRGTAGRIARHGAHVGGHGDLEELQIARCGLLVVPEPSGDVERLARLEAKALAVLE